MSGGSSRGFTLLEVVVGLAIFGILAAVVVPLSAGFLERTRADETRRELERLKAGIVGDPAGERDASERAFGFVGDLGALPDSLQQLVSATGLPSHSVEPEHRLGVGWRGPYLPVRFGDDSTALSLDAFGRPLRYAPGDTTVEGRAWAGFLRSAGPDGTQATSDDIVAPLLEGEVRSELHGFVVNDVHRGLIGSPVRVVFRRDGAIADTVVFTDDEGHYVVEGLAVGPAVVRATAGPSGRRISVEQGSEAVTGNQENTVEFTINNASPGPVTLTTLTVFLPPSLADRCYRSASIEGINLFPGGTNVRCSGETLTFDEAVTLESGVLFTKSVARARFTMREAVSFAPSVVSAGGPFDEGSGRVVLGGWRDGDGFGNPVSMQGVQLTVTFSDGLIATFTTPGG